MKKNSPPRIDAVAIADDKFGKAKRAEESAKRKMKEVKKAMDCVIALAEKHPIPETLASFKLAIQDYVDSVDNYVVSVRKRTDTGIALSNENKRYHEADARYRVSQARKKAR